MKKLFRFLPWALLIALILFVIIYAWPRAPIITAFASKGMCSNVFLADKDPARVEAEDLSFFPISLAKTKIDYDNKIVSSKVLGLAKRVAVYREGAGAVVVLKKSIEELRKGSFKIPDPGYSQDTIPWPKGDILQDTVLAGINYGKLNEVINGAFDPEGQDPIKKTLGLVVVYDNFLIGEKYLGEYDDHTMFNGWSMTKTFTGAMAGILVEEGLMDLNAPNNIPKWSGDERKNITMNDVLHLSSGLEWVENYFTISEVTVMLMRSEDMLASVTSCELIHEPGTVWNYSGGDMNLGSGMIRIALGDDDTYHSFPYKKLMHRIGMLNTVIETDASGLFVTSSFCYGTTRDWARLGLLFLNNGIFESDTILTKEWVEYCHTPAPASDGMYGATFWLKEHHPENDLIDVPNDVYFADGFLGQRIYIIPSKKLVVVRMGYGMNGIKMNDLLRDIIAALPGGG